MATSSSGPSSTGWHSPSSPLEHWSPWCPSATTHPTPGWPSHQPSRWHRERARADRPRLPTPQYEQVRAQIAALVSAGDLDDGNRLPTVRALANDLGIAPGTIARAYQELEAAG